jgi:hypothetical protein
MDIDWRDYEGFIYKVIEISTGRHYVGKKNFYSKKTPKGKKNKVKTESNWQSYTTSSKILSNKIKANIADYKFEISCLCKDKSSLSYMEMNYMMYNNSMTDELSYNENCRITLLNKLINITDRVTIVNYKN